MLNTLLAFPIVGPILAGIIQAAVVAAKIANAIPGVVWALVLLVPLFFWWSAAGDRNEAQAGIAALNQAIGNQKIEAGKILALEVAKTERINADLRESHNLLEKTSVNRIAESKAADTRLAVSIADAGGQLRDPNARCGSSGDEPETELATTADHRRADLAKAGGLLSGPLTGLLQKLTSEAGEINDAYAICRQDSIDLRAHLSHPS